MTKVLFLEAAFGLLWAACALFDIQACALLGSGPGAEFVIAMVMLLIYGTELGGLAPHMRSDLDPFLSKLGIGAIGNLSFAGSIRTRLLNGSLRLKYYRDRCVGCRSCAEVCPQGVWEFGKDKKAVFARKEACTACRACIVQCKGDAIRAERKE